MISFCITTKNEGSYVDTLLTQIVPMLVDEDEIVIIDDYSDDGETIDIINNWRNQNTEISLYQRRFQRDWVEIIGRIKL